MDRVVGDFVVPALCDKNCRGMQQQFTDVMDVVVVHNIVFIYVFRAWAIATEHDAASTEMVQMVAGNFDSLTVQIQADAGAAA